MSKIFDCIILGGGPAGLSASLYCARGNLTCGIIDASALGGTPYNYCEIENYLGLGRISGSELCEKFEQHVEEFNIEKFPYEEIQKLDLYSDIKKITTLDKEFLAKTVVVALGAKPKRLNVEGEIEGIGKGVSYCAVCDGAFYKDKVVAVVGGGNSALEEALYLTRFAKKVYIIHRRNEFRADDIIQKRVLENNKIELVLNSVVKKINLKDKVHSIDIYNNQEQSVSVLNLDGLFIYIGINPNCELIAGQLEQNQNGFILTDEYMRTNIEGVYAIGDIRNTPLRQVITAVCDGAIAGVEVSKYLLNKKEKIRK